MAPARDAILATVAPEITSPANERIKWLVRLRDRAHRDDEGVFVVEGRRLYERAVAAGLSPIVTFASDDPPMQAPGEIVTVSPAGAPHDDLGVEPGRGLAAAADRSRLPRRLRTPLGAGLVAAPGMGSPWVTKVSEKPTVTSEPSGRRASRSGGPT